MTVLLCAHQFLADSVQFDRPALSRPKQERCEVQGCDMTPRRAPEQIDAGSQPFFGIQTPGFEEVVRDRAFSADLNFQPIP